MEKVTDFLEKHVQWIVLGIAVLFFGFMAYSYVLETPVTVELQPGQKLKPGEITEAIVQGPVQRLNGDLQKGPPDMPPKEYVKTFVANMGFATPDAEKAFGPLAQHIFPGSGKVVLPEGEDVASEVGDKIAALPVAPPVREQKISQGRMVAKWPDPNWKKPRNNPNVQQAMIEGDVDWVTVGGTILAADLEAAFEKAYGTADVPPTVWETKILRVEAQREEQLPNGKWGSQVNVPPLKIHKVMPFPAPGANEVERLNYLDWLSRNEALVVAPPFYELAKGQPWYAPGMPAPAAVNRPVAGGGGGPAIGADPTFDPSNPPRRRLTPDEKEQVRQFKEMQRNGGETPIGPRGPNVGPSYAPSFLLQDEAPEFQRPGRGLGAYGGGGGYDPANELGMPADEAGAAYDAAGAGVKGGFNVTNLAKDLTIWSHDETATPGKTYRYRLRYHLLNPLHKTLNIAKDKKVEDQLALTSGWSRWTEPVTISEGVKFWLAGNPSAKEAKFKVFVWQAGNWQSRDEKAGPGDVIPGTNWMVVDLRPNLRGGGYHVLVVDATGRTDRRDPRRDEADPARIELEEQAAGAAAAAR